MQRVAHLRRRQSLIGIVGSSNFTRPGLTSNRELNLCHRILFEPEEANDPTASQIVGLPVEDSSRTTLAEHDRLSETESRKGPSLNLVHGH